MENIQFTFVAKDGTWYPINIGGVSNIFEAADELRSSILNGDLTALGVEKLEDVVQITDVEG